MLPDTLESVTKIKSTGVIPVGVVTKFTIDDRGNRKVKRRRTHDASFPPPSEKSINNRMNEITPFPRLRVAAEEINMVKREKQYSSERLLRPPSQMFV